VTVLDCHRSNRSSQENVTSAAPRLAFSRNDHHIEDLTAEQLASISTPEPIVGFDPYYGHVKRHRAVPIEPVLEHVFAPDPEHPLRREQFVLRALDGYVVLIPGERLLEGGAAIAFEDLDVPGWEPIGPHRANPAPFYLVWRYASQQDLTTHPRPWLLASIEIGSFDAIFPHVTPRGEPSDSPAQRGFSIFRNECIRCHAINREGGRVGPDLNVPLSIVEYRPEDQIRRYIRNPLQFRYGIMPPHPQLTDDDLTALIAYFRAMSVRKFDSDAVRSDGGVH
jgi:mono/diheme cytochrome c family protein